VLTWLGGLLTTCSQTHGSRTIEGDLFAALAKAGAISEENARDHKKVDLQRAARTDAGVHAAGNW
jgi:tRNA pseudouridine38-40 synthase